MRLHERFTSVTEVMDRRELLDAVVGFAKQLEFETVGATVVKDLAGAESRFAFVYEAPEAYRAIANNCDDARRDPVSQHCKRSSLPIVWGQHTYVEHGLASKWERQAAFGYRHGLAVALHLPQGLHFFIGVNRDQPLPPAPSEVSRMAAELQLFAVHAQDAAMRVLLPDLSASSPDPRLSRRELECLRWTMEGKTAWELGRILGISEQTAVRHLSNAAHKLGCVSKHHAVVKAMREGLLG